MDSENVQLVLFFDKKTLDTLDVIEYFEKMHLELYDSYFYEISYSVPKGILFNTKTIKFNPRNVQKLINETQGNRFDIFSLLPEWGSKSIDIKCSINYEYSFDIDRSYLQLSFSKENQLKNFRTTDWIDLYLKVIKYFEKYEIRIQYGYVFSMERKKFPALLISGIGYFYSSKQEKSDLQVWNEKKSELDFKVWRVFWGNLITQRHLKPGATIKQVEKVVGKDNFYYVTNDLYFFGLPTAELSYGSENENLTKNLTELLNIMV